MRRFKLLSLTLVMVIAFSLFSAGFTYADQIYNVKKGDVLWKIARNFGLTWEDLSTHNELKNPNLIFPDQKIAIPEKDKKIVLLATADLHGRIYAYEYAIDSIDKDAGIAKAATLIKEQRAQNDNIILMDLGDTTQDNSVDLFNNDPIHPMVDALNFLNYNTWTLGNHEFNYEKSFLDNNIATFKNTVLGANIYKEDGTRFVKPYTVIEKDGVKVAIVGLVPPAVPTWEAAAPSHFEGLTFTNTVDEAKKVVAELDGKYDVLVGAFHLGPDGEHGYEGAVAIAEAAPEFDVIFMGHAHSRIENDIVNGVTLIEPGAYGWAVSKAVVSLKDVDGKYTVNSIETTNLKTVGVKEDPAILERYAYVHEASISDANEVVGTVTDDFIKNVDYITGNAHVTTMPTSQVEDTALIDLINEVQLFYTGADVAAAATFTNDMNLVAGDFKKKDVAYIYKYPNTLMGVNITGKNLKAYMEWSASYFNTAKDGDVTISFNPGIRGYNYDMFDGVNYDIDISKEPGNRIVNLTMNGKQIVDDQLYKLAVNNYRFGTLLGLGLVTEDSKYYDSYTLMQDAGRIRDLIIKYIKQQKNGVASPSVNNNWHIVGADLENPLKDKIYQMIIDGEITIPVSEDGRTPNVAPVNVYDLLNKGYFADEYEPLTILHTNDIHGFFVEGKYDGMGAPKMATYFNDIKSKNKNTLILDAGDALQGNSIVTLSKGEYGIELMNALGYDAMAVGNHEFDYGSGRLLELNDMANFPILAANIKKADGTDFVTPYIIKQVDGLKVGIFGLATPETLFKSHPDNTVGLTFEDPLVVGQQMVDQLSSKVDVLIALVHLGYAEGSPLSIDLANAVEGIDLIIDGHSHTELPKGEVVNGALIVQAGTKTMNVGKVNIAVKNGQVAFMGAQLFTKKESAALQDDPTLTAFINDIVSRNAVITEEVVASSPIELNGVKADVRTGETTMGNMITAALLDVSGADVALTNGGGIRASIDVGDVTRGEILDVLPYGNTVRVIELTGADIVSAIENGVRSYPETQGGFPHIAGMTVTFDSTKPAGSRVVDVKIGENPIDLNATYSMATNDFLVAGGDGYTMFTDKKVVAEYGAMDEVLTDYMNNSGFDAAKITGKIKDIASEISLILNWFRVA